MKVALRMWATAVVLCLLTAVARAQTPHVGYSFAIPQGVDPPVVIDLTALNANYGFTGADLMDYGIEIHGQILYKGAYTYSDIVQLQFALFAGPVPDFTVYGSGPWAPWDIGTQPGTVAPGYETVTLTAHGPVGEPSGSAPLNDYFPSYPGEPVPGPYSSYLAIGVDVTGDQAFIDAFRANTFQVTATQLGSVNRSVVPEPGMAGVGLGLVSVLAGTFLTRRRKA